MYLQSLDVPVKYMNVLAKYFDKLAKHIYGFGLPGAIKWRTLPAWCGVFSLA